MGSEEKKIDRRKFLKTLGLGGGLAAVGGAGYLLGNAHAIPAPSIGSTIEPGSMAIPPDYLIYKDGATILARNGDTGLNEFSGTDPVTVIAAVIAAAPSKAVIYIKDDMNWANAGITIDNKVVNLDFLNHSITNGFIKINNCQEAWNTGAISGEIRNLTLISSPAAQPALDRDSCVGHILRNIHIVTPAGIGFRETDATVGTGAVGSSFDNVVYTMWIVNPTSSADAFLLTQIAASGPYGINNNRYYDINIANTSGGGTGNGLHLGGQIVGAMQGHQFYGLWIQGFATGLRLSQGNTCLFDQCWFEGNTVDITVDTGKALYNEIRMVRMNTAGSITQTTSDGAVLSAYRLSIPRVYGFNLTTPTVPATGVNYYNGTGYRIRITILTADGAATAQITDPDGNVGTAFPLVAGNMIILDQNCKIKPTYTTLTWKFYAE